MIICSAEKKVFDRSNEHYNLVGKMVSKLFQQRRCVMLKIDAKCQQCGGKVVGKSVKQGDEHLFTLYSCKDEVSHFQVASDEGKCPSCKSGVRNSFCMNPSCLLCKKLVRIYDADEAPAVVDAVPPEAKPEVSSSKLEAEPEKKSPVVVDDDDDGEEDVEGVAIGAPALPASAAMFIQPGGIPKGQVVSEEAFQRIVSDLATVSLNSDFHTLKAAGVKASLIKKDARLEELKGDDPDLYIKIQDLIRGDAAGRKERQFNFNSLIQRGVDFSLLDQDISVSLARKRAEHLDGICKRKEFSKHLFELFQGHSQKPVLEDIQTGVELRTAQENERKKTETEMAQKEQEKKQEAEAQAQVAAAAQAKAEQDAAMPSQDEQRILTVMMDLAPLDWDDLELDDETRDDLESRKASAESIHSVQNDFNMLARMCQLGLHGQSMGVWKNFQFVAKGQELRKFDRLKAEGEAEAQKDVEIEVISDMKAELEALDASTEHGANERQAIAEELMGYPRESLKEVFGPSIFSLKQIADGIEVRELERTKAEKKEAQEKLDQINQAQKREDEEAERKEQGALDKKEKEKLQRKKEHDEKASKVGAGTAMGGGLMFLVALFLGLSGSLVIGGALAVIGGIVIICVRMIVNVFGRLALAAVYLFFMIMAGSFTKTGVDQWRDPIGYANRLKKASQSQPASRKTPERRKTTAPLPQLKTLKKTQELLNRRAPKTSGPRKLDGGAGVKKMTFEERCRELVRRVNGNRERNIVRVVGCEKNGVKLVELRPGQMIFLKYVKGSIALSRNGFARTFIKTGKEPPCGDDCLYPHVPRNVLAVLGLKEKPFGLAYPPMPLKLWWFWRNTTGDKIAIVFDFNGNFLANSGLAKNGKVNPVVFSYTVHKNSEYEKLKKQHRLAR